MKFRLLDIATADMAFEAFGKDLSELFENIGLACTEVMADPESIAQKEERSFGVSAHDLEALAFDFISELLFIKDTEGIIFSKFRIAVEKKKGCALKCTAWGEMLDRDKHEIRTEVKAATYNQMKIKKNGEWRAQVVLDT